jgi:hypothetical protein
MSNRQLKEVAEKSGLTNGLSHGQRPMREEDTLVELYERALEEKPRKRRARTREESETEGAEASV